MYSLYNAESCGNIGSVVVQYDEEPLTMNPEVFREYDVRGLVEKDLTYEFVRNLGKAVGTLGIDRGVKTMTVGRDCRLSSKNYRDALIEGLVSAGIDVIDIGLAATPMLYFSIQHLGADGGVMITGSHNPPDFNGFKICIGIDTIYGDEIQHLQTIIERGAYASGQGKVTVQSIVDPYHECIFRSVSIARPLHIAVDGGNGVGGFFSLPLFERFGCPAVPIYCEMDGRFPNHFPDPTIEDNLDDLIRVVKEKHCDFGIAFDGDADRIGVVTSGGRIVRGDELLLLFSRAILKKNPGATIIGEVKCSRVLYDDITRHGGRPIMWKAGHSLIKGKMREEKALLAGEMSGHLFFADRYFGYDDAIYAAARLLEIVSHSNNGIEGFLSDIPVTFSTPEIRIDCPDHVKFGVVEEVKDFFRRGYKINDIDGVRIEFSDGWGLVRASNTQPVLVLRFESTSEEGLARIRKLIEEVLHTTMTHSV